MPIGCNNNDSAFVCVVVIATKGKFIPLGVSRSCTEYVPRNSQLLLPLERYAKGQSRKPNTEDLQKATTPPRRPLGT